MQNKTSAEVADEKITELRAVIREGNQLLGDLKRERKACEDLFATLIPEHVEAVLNREVKDGLAEFNDSTRRYTDEAAQTVLRSFDELKKLLIGGTKADRRRGEVGLDTMIQNARIDNEAPPNS